MSKIVEELIEAYKPTEEDLKKELTYNELVELCKRTQCRVDMWKWNVVYDYTCMYREMGRFDGRPPKFINKLLVKTYYRRKQIFDDIEKESADEKIIEWKYRKKESLMSLDLWRYEDEMKRQEMEEGLRETPDILTLPTNTESSQSAKNADIQVFTPRNEECEECIIDGYYKETDDLGCKNNDGKGSKHIVDVGADGDTECSSNLQNHAVAKDLMNCNSESLTVGTSSVSNVHSQGQTINEKVKEANLLLRLSQLRENTLEFLGTETQTQTQTYEDFTQKVPQSSTQDTVVRCAHRYGASD